MPVKVNFIMVRDYDDDYADPLVFYLKSGNGNSKVWNSDSLYNNWGYFDLSNGEVARHIQQYEKEHSGADVSFGHKTKDGDIHADWDWSEVSGTAKKYLSGHRTKSPKKSLVSELNNAYKRML